MQDMAEVDETQAEAVEVVTEEAEAPEEPGEQPEAEGEVEVTIGDAPPQDEEEPAKVNPIKVLRQKAREDARRIRELEARVQMLAPKPAEMPKKPAPADFDYDLAKYEAALLQWNDAKRQQDEREQRQRAAAEQAQRDWQEKLAGYGRAASALRVTDFAEAEDDVKAALSVEQQGVIIHGADNPALLVYALGRDDKRLAEIAAIKDPVKFAFAVARLEKDLKVAPKAKPPAPERIVRGAGTLTGTVDSTLEKLRAEADRTGDRTKVAAYIRAQKQKER